MKHPPKRLKITIEGTPKSGKSTVTAELMELLTDMGAIVTLDCQPETGTESREQLARLFKAEIDLKDVPVTITTKQMPYTEAELDELYTDLIQTKRPTLDEAIDRIPRT